MIPLAMHMVLVTVIFLVKFTWRMATVLVKPTLMVEWQRQQVLLALNLVA
jgi:hypothetical protein